MENDLQLEEGNIVEVPYGMRLVTEKKKPKSWLTYWNEKNNKNKQKEESDQNEDLEGDFDEGDEEEVDYEDEEEDKEEEENLEAFEEEDEDDSSGKTLPKVGGYEKAMDWEVKNVPIFKTTAAEELAKNMGLPTKHLKMIPKPIVRKIEAAHVTYAGVQLMRVGKRGKLYPIKGDSDKIKVFDEDIWLDKPRNLDLPKAFLPKSSKVSKNPYNDIYNIGNRVSFIKENIEMTGTVKSYTEKTIGVSLNENTDLIFVEYTDPTLKKIKSRKMTEIIKEITPEDVLSMTDIPLDMRKMVIDMYVSILDEIRVIGKSQITPPATPSRIKETLKDVVLNKKPLELISWDAYYSENFKKWVRAHHHEYFVKQVDTQYVSEMADFLLKKEFDSDKLIKEIFENGNITYETTVSDILEYMRKIKDITIFQAMCIRSFEKEKYSGRGDTSGSDLATLIADIIANYYRNHPPDLNAYYKVVFDYELEKLIYNYEPTDQDRLLFEAENLEILADKYEEHKKKYEQEIEEFKEMIMKEKRENQTLEQPKEQIRTPPSLKAENREQVERFEQLTFASYGSSVHSYLSNVLLPHIFLEGMLAKYSKFFRSKVSDGSFPFSALVGANIAHYFPEFVMNKKLSDDDWLRVGDVIGEILHNDISNVVDTYINLLNPTSKMGSSGLTYANMVSLLYGFEDMLVDPIAECYSQTSSGYRKVIKPDPESGDKGKYIMDPVTKMLLEEKIPYEDLAICYDQNTSSFTCHSIRDVMLSIARGDLTNPHTNKKYPQDFVDRIKKRKQSIIDNMKQPDEAEPLPIEAQVKKTPEKKIQEKKKEQRKRHVAPSKGKYESITKMLVLGAAEEVALFDTSFSFNIIGDEEGEIVENMIPITTDKKSKNINAVVLSFYSDQPETIEDLQEQLKDVPKGVKNIYVVGLDSENVVPVNRVKMSNKIKTLIPSVKKVFYSSSYDDIVDSLIDVAIDIEGVKAV